MSLIIKDSSEYSVWKLLALLDKSSSVRDPLNFNQFFGEIFPKNQYGDNQLLQSIIDITNKKIDELGIDFFSRLDITEAMAVNRDLNMIASALTRWNKPLGVIPSLENILIIISKKTMEVPTDTVFSYGPRNPYGKSRRTFTEQPEELLFIDSFVAGMTDLPVCVAGLEMLQYCNIEDPLFEQIAKEIQDSFASMVKNIIVVRRKIPAAIFTNVLRPYFDPKIIGGTKYFAPGGAQMPICLMDFLLWGIEYNDDIYIRYFKECCEYLPNAIRIRIGGMYKAGSLSVKLLNTVEGISVLTATQQRSIQALINLLDEMEKFRNPHLAVAKDNMKIRPTQSVGSGGYDSSILEYLLSCTKKCKFTLKRMLKEKT